MLDSKNFRTPCAPQVASMIGVLMMFALSDLNTRAQTVTLTPGDNSTLQVNTSGASAGVVNWTVDGFNLLDPSQGGLQWLYYSTGGATTPQGIQAIGPASSSVGTILFSGFRAVCDHLWQFTFAAVAASGLHTHWWSPWIGRLRTSRSHYRPEPNSVPFGISFFSIREPHHAHAGNQPLGAT